MTDNAVSEIHTFVSLARMEVILFVKLLNKVVMYINVCVKIQKGQSTVDNSERLANIGHTRRRKTKQKQNTICVGYHYAQTNTNNVNKT